MGALVTIGDSLREAFFMFWETLWALVLGFALSGAVQAFVSRGQMQRVMGRHGPATLARSSLLRHGQLVLLVRGDARWLRSLFAAGRRLHRGDGVHVRLDQPGGELGIVLWLLIGWQFALAEFVGGVIMIVLLGLLLPRLIPRRLVSAARERLDRSAADGTGHAAVRPRNHADHAGHAEHGDGQAIAGPATAAAARWARRAGYTISDLTMLRRELVIGFVVAGLRRRRWSRPAFWKALFLHRPRLLALLENVVSARSSRSSASSARSATCRWRPRCGRAASASAAWWPSSSPT